MMNLLLVFSPFSRVFARKMSKAHCIGFWTGTPGNYTNPHAPEALSVVRKLVDNGQYADATTAAEKLSHDPSDVCIILMHNLPFHFINESYNIMLVGLPPRVEFKLIVILHYLPSIKISADLSGKQIKFAILIS
jgi:hypothetical protein